MSNPKVGEFWRNQRNGCEYRILSLPFWSDSPNENYLEQWVAMRNVATNLDYIRSMRSFMGLNRDQQKRFVRVGESRDVPSVPKGDRT